MSVGLERYQRRAYPVQVIRYDGTYSGATVITQWVSDHGGRAFFTTTSFELEVLTDDEGRRYVSPGDYVVLEEAKGFRVLGWSYFKEEFEPAKIVIDMSVANQSLIRQAYDDGEGGGGGLDLLPMEDGYVRGDYKGATIYTGIEVDGVLYSIVPTAGVQIYTVVVGDELIGKGEGPRFSSIPEAKAYIQGLTKR